MGNREIELPTPPASPDPAGWAQDCAHLLDWLDDAEAYHRARLEEVKLDREAVQRTRLLHLQWQTESAAEERDGLGAHSHISPGDIVHCKSIGEAYTETACLSGGLLRYHSAAELLIAAKLSTSKNVRNVAGDLRRRLEADANWEHHSPGVYKYLPYAEGGGKKPSRPVPASTIDVRPSPVYGRGGDGPS